MKLIVLSILLLINVACVSVGDSECVVVPGTLICVEKPGSNGP